DELQQILDRGEKSLELITLPDQPHNIQLLPQLQPDGHLAKELSELIRQFQSGVLEALQKYRLPVVQESLTSIFASAERETLARTLPEGSMKFSPPLPESRQSSTSATKADVSTERSPPIRLASTVWEAEPASSSVQMSPNALKTDIPHESRLVQSTPRSPL